MTFTPVEVGEFTVHVRWNGRDIEGKVKVRRSCQRSKVRKCSSKVIDLTVGVYSARQVKQVGYQSEVSRSRVSRS